MGELNMVFAGLFVPDLIKCRSRLKIFNPLLSDDRASLVFVALYVSDELEHGRGVSVADLGSLHLEPEDSIVLLWVPGDVLDEVGVGDGLVSIVVAVVSGVSASLEGFAIVPLDHSFSRLTVKINDLGVVASQLVGGELGKVKDLAADQMLFTHSWLLVLKFFRFFFNDEWLRKTFLGSWSYARFR